MRPSNAMNAALLDISTRVAMMSVLTAETSGALKVALPATQGQASGIRVELHFLEALEIAVQPRLSGEVNTA